MPVLSIAEPLQINAVIWIGSLAEDEQELSGWMVEDLENLTQTGGLPVFEHAVENRGDLFKVLDQLAEDAKQGLRPILHFDTHGNSDAGISLKPSGEWASWPELMDRLRAINITTGNNLVVVFGLCHGLHFYKHAELKKAAPAYLFAAAEEAVTDHFLLDEVPEFYRQVQATGAFLEPFDATLGKEMTLINCQGLFLKALAHYVKTHTRGDVFEARVARVTQVKLQQAGVIAPTAEQLAEATAQIRAGLEPSEKIIEHFAPAFLVGRAPGFTYADVEALAGPAGPT
jgi:hypothetical protein